ncbi:MAG: hypothetical protein KF760_19685 [Candidatus Eremiobacteraeota bacterium]|nr:hypothetical protein [Candidatus Eremiobacteraeota bacterium]MCW5869131.1 hypothetical protein [Candidatus Eremiobacteraeota bacterium]
MKRLLGLTLLLCLSWAAVAETYRWSDRRGDKASVTHPGVPKNPALAKAFKARFFPNPERLHDPDFLVDWETTVVVGRSTPHYYSAVSRGLTLYKNSKGEVIGAHPGKIMETLTWDLRKNKEVTLEQLIERAQFSKLARLIGDHAEAREAFSAQARYGFYLRKDGVAFYDPDAPHVSFGIESVVPYAELLPLAAPHSLLLDSGVTGH